MNTDAIRALNDQFRTTFAGGRIVVTRGIAIRRDADEILQAVRTFDKFDDDNDPHHEHDSGAIKIDQSLIFFKIDYYNVDLSGGSPDPSDPTVTTRLITVMLGSEY